MHSIHSLLKQLEKEYPAFSFKPSVDFRWLPQEKTIFYDETSSDATLLLHELAHALLGHERYSRDIQLIEMEAAAWEHAKAVLSPQYKISIDDDIIQENLDTYRDWLHARSSCPTCKAIGIQSATNAYRCVACGTVWRVNSARTCALRRYKTN